MQDKAKMRLGLSMRGFGYHVGAWRHPDLNPGAQLDFAYYRRTAQLAEAAKLDMIFFADGNAIRGRDQPEGALRRSSQNAELEPITLLAALAAATKHIGLVATASTTYNDPYHVARKYASIDHISGGRAGWNMVTSWSDLEAQNFNRESHPGMSERHERAEEFIEVVTGLWDSWEDDAFVHDKASGIFYDPDRLHVLGHKGRHFQVRGPLSSARTPQGRPVLVQAGASDQGQELAAAFADVVYSSSFDIETSRAYYASVKGRLAGHGRRPDAMKIMPGVTPFVGRTRQEARAKFDQLQALVDPLVGLSLLYGQLGDLSAYPVDGPVPDISAERLRSGAVHLLELARREGLSIRQLYLTLAAGSGVRTLIGTPGDIVDDLEEWFTTGAADGFNICASHLPHAIIDFAELVLPELRRRNLFREEYEGATLRENLGLPAHVNRYTRARAALQAYSRGE